jgi:hypothetical protein
MNSLDAKQSNAPPLPTGAPSAMRRMGERFSEGINMQAIEKKIEELSGYSFTFDSVRSLVSDESPIGERDALFEEFCTALKIRELPNEMIIEAKILLLRALGLYRGT